MSKTSNNQLGVRIGDVAFNGDTQCFEALVTIDAGTRRYKYACAILGPMTMPFEQAAQGLQTQALRSHANESGLRAHFRPHRPVSRGRRQRFDPRRWLAQIGIGAQKNAA
jgi:hypothetical protein